VIQPARSYGLGAGVDAVFDDLLPTLTEFCARINSVLEARFSGVEHYYRKVRVMCAADDCLLSAEVSCRVSGHSIAGVSGIGIGLGIGRTSTTDVNIVGRVGTDNDISLVTAPNRLGCSHLCSYPGGPRSAARRRGTGRNNDLVFGDGRYRSGSASSQCQNNNSTRYRIINNHQSTPNVNVDRRYRHIWLRESEKAIQ
jgi:hypothetical protein